MFFIILFVVLYIESFYFLKIIEKLFHTFLLSTDLVLNKTSCSIFFLFLIIIFKKHILLPVEIILEHIRPYLKIKQKQAFLSYKLLKTNVNYMNNNISIPGSNPSIPPTPFKQYRPQDFVTHAIVGTGVAIADKNVISTCEKNGREQTDARLIYRDILFQSKKAPQ